MRHTQTQQGGRDVRIGGIAHTSLIFRKNSSFFLAVAGSTLAPTGGPGDLETPAGEGEGAGTGADGGAGGAEYTGTWPWGETLGREESGMREIVGIVYVDERGPAEGGGIYCTSCSEEE